MNPVWAITVPRAQAARLARLRLEGVDVLDAGEQYWLRGPDSEAIAEALPFLPATERFVITPEGALQPEGSRITLGPLPEGDWKPLREAVHLRISPPRMFEGLPVGPGLKLVRSDVPQPASLLLTSLQAWHAFAVQAPGLRLQRLQLAVSGAGEVVVRGTPLPPIQGRPYFIAHGLVLPCGFEWAPDLGNRVVSRGLALDPGELALFSEDGAYRLLRATDFHPATRSGARRMMERVSGDA